MVVSPPLRQFNNVSVDIKHPAWAVRLKIYIHDFVII